MSILTNKVAIVAGSSRGIGKAIAMAYAKEGAKVAVVARSESEGKLPGTIYATAEEITKAGGIAIGVPTDITSEESVAAMVKRVEAEFGPVDILCNSAAVIFYERLAETTLKRWNLIFNVNVTGAFILTKAVIPGMVARKSGAIIHLTSSGAVGARKGGNAYGSTKAALERMCKGFAVELKEHNIAVNCLDPGPIRTEGAVLTRGPSADWSGWGESAEVIPSALHLAVQTPASMTGQVLRRIEYNAKNA